MDPYWSFGGFDHHFLHQEWTLYAILELYADFPLPKVIKSTLRILLYLEDLDGSRLELRLIWSTLLCWIILGHPQKVVQKRFL